MWISHITIFLFTITQNPKRKLIDVDYTLPTVGDPLPVYEMKDNEDLQESFSERPIKLTDQDIQDEPLDLSKKQKLTNFDLKATNIKGILSKKKDRTFASKTVKIHSPIMDKKQPSLKFAKRNKKKLKLKKFREHSFLSKSQNQLERAKYEKRRSKLINESRIKLFNRMGYTQRINYINYIKMIQKPQYIQELEISESIHRHWNSLYVLYKIWSNNNSITSQEFREQEIYEYEQYNKDVESIQNQILPITREKFDSDLNKCANLIFNLKNIFVKEWGIQNVCGLEEKTFLEKYSENDITQDIKLEVTQKFLLEKQIPDIKDIRALRAILKTFMGKRFRVYIVNVDDFEDLNLMLTGMLEKIKELLKFENHANNYDLNIYCGEALYSKEKADACRKYINCFSFLTLGDMKYIIPSSVLNNISE